MLPAAVNVDDTYKGSNRNRERETHTLEKNKIKCARAGRAGNVGAVTPGTRELSRGRA